MAWTAQIIKKENAEGRLRVFVDYTNSDGGYIFKVPYDYYDSFSADDLNDKIKRRILQLNNLSEKEVDVPLSTTVSSEYVAPSPTTKQTEVATWSVLYVKLRRIKQLVDLGVIKSDDALYTNALQDVISGFKEEYLDYI